MAEQRLSAETVRSLAAQYPDWDPESVVRIAWRESNFVPTAFADDSDDLSYGLMQLNMKPGTANIEQLRQMYGITRNEELLNPVVNIRAAHVLWQMGGKSFSSGWNFVPPTVNYPTTGGSTNTSTLDDSGNPVSTEGFSIGEIALLKVWDTNHNGVLDKADVTESDIAASERIPDDAANKIAATVRDYADPKGVLRPGFLTAVKKALGYPAAAALMPDYSAHLKRATINMLVSSGDSISWTIPGVAGPIPTLQSIDDLVGGVQGLTDWAAGLSKLLNTIQSLGFWKKVGVGAIALIFIAFAFGLYNKDTVMPLITKGAVK